jgi:hypothetical protein
MSTIKNVKYNLKYFLYKKQLHRIKACKCNRKNRKIGWVTSLVTFKLKLPTVSSKKYYEASLVTLLFHPMNG